MTKTDQIRFISKQNNNPFEHCNVHDTLPINNSKLFDNYMTKDQFLFLTTLLQKIVAQIPLAMFIETSD